MRHRVKSNQLNKERDHARALVRNLLTSVILYEKVKTTKRKAKLIQPQVEKMITLARKTVKGDKQLRETIRKFKQELYDEKASRKLLEELAPRYADRNSGFTRIINIGHRAGDAAEMVQLELI